MRMTSRRRIRTIITRRGTIRGRGIRKKMRKRDKNKENEKKHIISTLLKSHQERAYD